MTFDKKHLNICLGGGSVLLCTRIFVITARKRSLQRLCRLCFHRCLSAHGGGACVAPPGIHTSPACITPPGMHTPGTHAPHPGTHAAPGGYFEMRSMSGWYASYSNAFLFSLVIVRRDTDVDLYQVVFSSLGNMRPWWPFNAWGSALWKIENMLHKWTVFCNNFVCQCKFINVSIYSIV